MTLESERQARDIAMDRVDRHNDEAWRQAAREAIYELAATLPEFISDAVWETGLPKPAEARRLGPIMAGAARRGIIEDTGRLQQSTQDGCHAMPRRVWRSLLYIEPSTSPG